MKRTISRSLFHATIILIFILDLITGGQQKFHYKGASHHVGEGQLVIMPPDELHDGKSMLESGYQTRVFALALSGLATLLS